MGGLERDACRDGIREGIEFRVACFGKAQPVGQICNLLSSLYAAEQITNPPLSGRHLFGNLDTQIGGSR